MDRTGVTVSVQVLSGRDLIPCDRSGLSDPYCIVTVGNTVHRTKIQKETLFPDWTGDHPVPFSFSLANNPAEEVVVDVHDWNRFTHHKRMGRVRIPLNSLVLGEKVESWRTLVAHKEGAKVSGELKISVYLQRAINREQQSMFLAVSSEDEPPLFTAIKNSDLHKVQQLLRDPKIDINRTDKYGYTPLHAACCLFSELDDEILSCLLNHKDINVNLENRDKNTPLHYFCAKFRSPNCTEAFDLFIAKGADVNAQNNIGETPLHKAIFNNSVKILMVNLLTQNGADVNRVNSERGETPLHYAVRLGREDLVSILLKAGAKVNSKGSKEVGSKTPLDLAIEEKHEKMAAILKRAEEIFDWLEEIGMEKYNTIFIKEEMYRELLPDLDEKTLDHMGITVTGHRLKILKAVKTLKDERETKPAETVAPVAEKKPEAAAPVDIYQELENLKYINNSGTWIIHNMELEFAVKLGSGASGTVYKGLYKGEEVATKVLKTDQTQKELEEFKKEFQIMSTIQSPYLVFFFGACLEPKLCMVMELCERGSLYHVLNDLTVTTGWKQVFRWAREMTLGIDCLHSYKPQVLHRDMKSLNLMVNKQFQVKVGDFGLSRFNTDTQKETLGKMRGTFAYCAPEVYFGEPFSTKADVFSVAVILWELVFRCIKGEYMRPYQEYPNLQFDFQIIIQSAKKNKRPTIPPSCPEEFRNLIEAGWAHKAEDRPSCKEILEKLDTLERDFESHPEEWAAAIQAPPPQ